MENEGLQLETDVFDSFETVEAVEYEALLRSLKRADGFTLLFARCNQRHRQIELKKKLIADLQDKKIEVLFFKDKIENLLDEIRKQKQKTKPDVVFVYGLESSMPKAETASRTPFVLNLNASRNSFPNVVDCPVVFCVPDYGIKAIMNGAPDFFSVRSGVFYFENDEKVLSKQISQAMTTGYQEHDSLLVEERRNRIENLQNLLAEYQSLPAKKHELKTEHELKDKLADIYYKSARFSEAEMLRIELLNEAQKNNAEDEISRQSNELALVYKSQGRYDEAEPLFKEALAIREKAFGLDHPSTATSYNNLADLYHSQGRYDEAEPLFKKALAIREKALGLDHPATATSYNNLAELYRSQGRYDEAEPFYQKALAIREKALGLDHPDTASSYNNLAGLYVSQGRYDEAEPLYQKALAIHEKALGLDHPSTAASYNNLAGLYDSQGRYDEAEPLYQKALAIFEKALGLDHRDTATSYMNLGGFYHKKGKSAEGLVLCEKALKIFKKALPTGHPTIRNCESWVEGIKSALGS